MIVVKWILGLALGGAAVMWLTVAVCDGMQREDETRDQTRLDRCAVYGERLPVAWQAYCEGQ